MLPQPYTAAQLAMLPQPYTAAQLAAEEAEGEKLRALFSADLKRNQEAKYGNKPSALDLLKNIPLINANGRAFHNKVDAYSSRGDLKRYYSSRQIVALAAAEILHPLLDMPPTAFHGIFVYCCSIAGTETPPKLNDSKRRVNLRGGNLRGVTFACFL